MATCGSSYRCNTSLYIWKKNNTTHYIKEEKWYQINQHWKSVWQNSTPAPDTNWKIGTEGNFLYLTKCIVSILLNGERLNAVLNLRTSQDYLLSHSYSNSDRSSSQCCKARRGNKDTDLKGRNRTVSICRWRDMIFYVANF